MTDDEAIVIGADPARDPLCPNPHDTPAGLRIWTQRIT
jgi:hypothetical protein